jgi:hypothetical protein
LVGFSNGGALALMYALDSIGDESGEIAVAPYRQTEDGQSAGVTADDLKRQERHAPGKRYNPCNGYSG